MDGSHGVRLKCNQIAEEPDRIVKIQMAVMQLTFNNQPLPPEARALDVHQRIEEWEQHPLIGFLPSLCIQFEVVSTLCDFKNNTESLALVAGRLSGLVETSLAMKSGSPMMILEAGLSHR